MAVLDPVVAKLDTLDASLAAALTRIEEAVRNAAVPPAEMQMVLDRMDSMNAVVESILPPPVP